jgi:GH43 family beta-xylosidase
MKLKPFALAALGPFLLTAMLEGLPTLAQGAAGTATARAGGTFKNPLLPSGPDPWVIPYKGMYYYMNTTGKNLTIWATADITDLRHARKRVVWTPPPTGPYSRDVWAPELHRFNGRWYLYFAADDGSNNNHRIFALENTSDDPLEGTWKMKGQVADRTNKWAIDPSAFEVNGQQYLLWSGWKGDTNGEQDIFIAHLKNPWTIDSERTLLSFPKYPWEHVGDLLNDPALPHVEVNEGPEILIHGQDIFMVYSGSACWTDYYELGVMEAHVGADLLSTSSWQKFDHPFFRQNPAASVFGPGHNGFFKSPDGKQDWIIYHANPGSKEGCGNMRSPRAQPFTWNADGTPNFGQPIGTDVPLNKPSR